MTWLQENACAPIRLRVATEILPPGNVSDEEIAELRDEVRSFRTVKHLTRRQWQNGSWSGNVLGIAPSKAQGIKDVGTVAQYRRLVELGAPRDVRPFRFADRLFFRILSKDDTPSLWFEYQKPASESAEFRAWSRDMLREGVACALAHAGHGEDPRVRGGAHRIISGVSRFLRSDLATDPLVKKGSKYVLDPDAQLPTVFSVAMLAYMPRLQRERAGFVDRLGRFLDRPPPQAAWSMQVAKRTIKPTFHILGNPLQADDDGNADDIPWALHWIELLVRLGMLEEAPVAQKVLAKLLEDCDEEGTWNPKNLRAIPRSASKLAVFAFPLELDGKTPERRRTDVTFRLALIAKLADWKLEFV